MTYHNNVHIPKESWPNWTWYAIEFFIVLAASLMISDKTMQYLHEAVTDPVIQNWVFWSIVAILFFVWYVVIRGIILKKPILENRR